MEPNQIKSLMVLNKITGASIARQEKVTQTWVSLVVNRKKRSKRIEKAIAKALKMKYADLWGRAA